MKHTLTLLFLVLALTASAQKLPDTSKAPKVYWSDLIQLQQLNNEATRRIHKLDIPALKRDTLDLLNSEMVSLIPVVYGRTYRDSTKKKGAGK